MRCLVHYFERVTDSTPTGFVSFERKVLPRRAGLGGVTYPDVDAWMKSSSPLCQFRVRGLVIKTTFKRRENDVFTRKRSCEIDV